MKKWFVILSLILLDLVGLSGCYDMNYDDLDSYYDYFDDTVYLTYFNDNGDLAIDTTKSIEDHFYNKETQDDFAEDLLVDTKYYGYFAVQLNSTEATKFSDLCLYIRTEEDAQMEIRFYIVSELPVDKRGYNVPLYELDGDGNIKLDSDGNPILNVDDNYVNPLATVTTSFRKGEFKDIYLRRWNVNGEEVKKITLNPDDYLLIQFVNNTGYGKDLGYQSVRLTMTNFIFNRG